MHSVRVPAMIKNEIVVLKANFPSGPLAGDLTASTSIAIEDGP
jgi:hypothetical protein